MFIKSWVLNLHSNVPSLSAKLILPEIIVHMLESLHTLGHILIVQLGIKIMSILLYQALRTEYVEPRAFLHQANTHLTEKIKIV